MKIIAFIEEEPMIEKILRHCDLWMVAEPSRSKEEPARPPPTCLLAENTVPEPVYLWRVYRTMIILLRGTEAARSVEPA
jgi:hypothetical protein